MMIDTDDTKHLLFETALKNTTDELESLSHWLMDIAEKIGFSARGLFKLDLVLSEVVSNIIQYAFEDSEEHEISVELQSQGSMARVQIRDSGIPFDPTQSPEVELPTCLEETPIGGLGIHLIRNYCNELSYHRQDNINILTAIICDTE
jgi:anti-sigma regulatory factor (Ser/Thr protein kinase)